MSAINSGLHPKLLWPGIQKVANISYNDHKKEYVHLFDKTSSNKRYEEIQQEIGFQLAAEKGEGEPIRFDTTNEGYTTRITNVAYALGYIVTREELADNLYFDKSSRRAKMLSRSFNQTKETLGANIYNRAFNSSFTYGDGKEICATDHPLGKGGTFSNELDPAASLSHESIEDLNIQIMGAVDDANLTVKLMPQCLIVPRQLWYRANRILKSSLQNDTAENATNVLKNAFPKGIEMNHYLTDANNWFIRTDIQHGEGLIYQERSGYQFEQDNDFNTKNAMASGYERYAFSIHDPRALYGSAPA